VRPTEARVYLEAPSARRERDYLDACLRSRALHRGLVAPGPGPARYAEFLDRAGRPDRRSFFVIAAATAELAGVVEILDMLPEPALAGRLAYCAFVPHAGTGLMCEGVRLAVDAAFRDVGLARLAADIEPGNRRSRALAQRLGFRCDQARRVSLKIGTRWRDHERWLLERADWPGAVTTPTCARS
jgi:ribosomal-protein-alanine N-acetyltransferase